ncbi:DUF2726 domain-containing protein [Rehaibacterium terrae]|uniref:DUF2726 domain-containing protein n=1 Tax=Rehaibacterium terrae TaxID=1341696 RepID=A0A7W7Y069_9GAMM|nr:DUF2726 domain-containing protein [Rehaibacterium terrae]MBB5015704.1 hypothetical protein [Rehaibacterium terrae]
MTWLLILVVLVVLVVVVLAAAAKSRTASSGDVGFPYEPARFLFSAAERSFLGVLDQAVGPEYRVFGKVRLADLAKVKGGLNKSARQGALNRVAAKHLDFVVCRSSDLSVVCAFEINDRSHASQRAQDRDELVAQVCRTIGLPLVAMPAKQAYSVLEVRKQFLTAVSPAPVVAQVGS